MHPRLGAGAQKLQTLLLEITAMLEQTVSGFKTLLPLRNMHFESQNRSRSRFVKRRIRK